MRKLAFATALVAAMTLGGWGPTHACEGEEVLFEDSFEVLDPAWGRADSISLVDEQLQLASKKMGFYLAISHFSTYDDADLCVTIKHVKGPDDMSGAGIIFWYDDAGNFYLFEISPFGTWQALRWLKNKWLTIAPWGESPAIKKGAGGVNKLRVLTQGKTATVFINDRQVAKFRGVPPKDGQLVGVAMEQFSDSPVTVTFDDFKVTSP